jgi:hypothetical protein
MQQAMSEQVLECENVVFLGTGGRSEENRCAGFRPAFFDLETETIYPACFANGTPAPFHLLDGLPAEIVVTRTASGRVASLKASVVSGFVREGRFYTREAAAQAVSRAN